MGLKLFGYSELSSDFGDWIAENCSNCGDNYAKIPDCFFGEGKWSKSGASEVTIGFNGAQHAWWGCDLGEPWRYHYDDCFMTKGALVKTTHWPPSHKITAVSQEEQGAKITYYDSDHIKAKLCQELEKFKDKEKYATENGLITYMNIIGKFMIEHFTFVTSPFSTTLLIIYEDTPHTTIDNVPQGTLGIDGEKNPPDESTRNLVHNQPIKYYIDNIFGNVKTSIRKVHWKYKISVTDHDGSGGTKTF